MHHDYDSMFSSHQGKAAKRQANADLLAEVGDYVAKGQPIALSGRSGEAPYPALYYLVRENGEARSPRTYRLWL